MESYPYANVHRGFRSDYLPAVLLAVVSAYLLTVGAWTAGAFFLVTALVLYNALQPDAAAHE